MADLNALVASPWWRWMGGMWWDARLGGTCPLCDGVGGFRWREADGSENGEQCPCAGRIELYPAFRNEVLDAKMRACGVLPDPTDPATLGCLLALAREAWGDPTITTHCWRVAPHVVARAPDRGPERWSAAGASVEEMLLDPQVARDWRAAPGWDDVPRQPHGALCPNFRGPTEAAALIAAILAAPPPGVDRG